MGNTLLIILLLIISLLSVTCQAPHDNPVDPDNPANSLYYIEGMILNSEAASQPLEGVSVCWKPENTTVLTNSSGYFKLNCESQSDGYICFSKPGFNPDSLYISMAATKIVNIEKRLNYIPVLDSIYIYSSIRNKYTLPENQIVVEAYLSDKDNDIDSVIIDCVEFSSTFKLQKISSKYFEGKFNDYDLGLTSFEQLIGKPINISVSSPLGVKYIGSSFVRRVISTEVQTISPKNADTILTTNPQLKWIRFEPGFPFSYMIEIYTDEPEPRLITKKENISLDDIFYDVPVSVTPTADNNRFFWVIWCIDEFKNRSRSKPAGFIVQ